MLSLVPTGVFIPDEGLRDADRRSGGTCCDVPCKNEIDVVSTRTLLSDAT